MDLIGLRGERVRLVPPDRTLHLENALTWLNDPDVTATLKVNFGVSRGAEEAFFARNESSREPDMLWAIHVEDGRHVGFCSLHLHHWRFRSAHGGLFLGDRTCWGRGHASDAVRVRTRFAFDQLGLHRIEGHTFNPAMRRVFEKCGYRHEGTARQKFWRDGRWYDAELYAILAEEFRGPTVGPA